MVVGGTEYAIDVLVMATGFETGYAASELTVQKVGFELVGKVCLIRFACALFPHDFIQ